MGARPKKAKPVRSEGIALRAYLSPSGRVAVDEVDDPLSPRLKPGVAGRILAAFERGTGHGLLQLGAVEVETELDATLAYWRELGGRLVGAVCGALDPLAPDSLVIPEPRSGVLETQVERVPPMRGAERVEVVLLRRIWDEVAAALIEVAAESEGGIRGYLHASHSVWHVAGRVCLHLAENKRDPELPFAFIATYARPMPGRRVQHVPLSRALQEYAGAGDRSKLLSLLKPLKRAAEGSEVLRELIETGDVYHPLAWSAEQAHSFLVQSEDFERSGVVVRLPDWWKSRPRPRVQVTVGGDEPAGAGLGSLLDFDLSLTLGGDALTDAEIEQLLQASAGLMLMKGQWVEVDPDKLAEVLDHWREVADGAAAGGVSFAQAMRMLSGADAEQEEDEDRPNWSSVVAGKWLSAQLEALRSPEVDERIEANAGLVAELRPYQKIGVQWLWTLQSLGIGGCLADDMGLGKTIQVIALLNMLHEREEGQLDLLVVPASLVGNWRVEIERFAPKLRVLVAHGSAIPARKLKALPLAEVERHQLVITTYGTAMRTPWMSEITWRSVVLDEAQAIKNPSAKQTRAMKKIPARWRLALTGTPVENRLGDLWSIFDFLNAGLLGSAKRFTQLCKRMSNAGGDGYAPLRRLVSPYILRRLKTDKRIIDDLPDKTEMKATCLLSKPQAALYKQAVKALELGLSEAGSPMERRGLVLASLMRFKQICNHPSQWLGDGEFAPAQSGKFQRLAELCEPIAERQEKVLIFTQFRTMTQPIQRFLNECFGRPGLVLHGGTPVKKRPDLVRRFQEDEEVRFMVLSIKAGGTGLNLTAANHVIHFDRWWNPAVENQATDRAYRIGQKRNVLVHKFVCRGTIEERIDALISSKQSLSDQVLSGGAEAKLTELSNDDLLAMVKLDIHSAVAS